MVNKYFITDKQLLQEIDKIQGIMIAVATGQSFNLIYDDQYQEILQTIRQGIKERGLEDPNYFDNLVQWQGKWQSGDLPSYNERRKFVKDLYAPSCEYISNQKIFDNIELYEKSTGWPNVDRKIAVIKKALCTANEVEHYQSIGLICREIILALAEEAFNPSKHTVPNGTPRGNATTIIPAIIDAELPGSSNERLRKYVKSSWDLANELQHESTADYRHALLNVSATLTLVQILAIITGKFDR